MKHLSSDLREFIRLLNAQQVEYLIVGAWSLGLHGRPRYTGDVDIFVRRDVPNAAKLLQVLDEFGFGNLGINREDFLKPDHVVQLGVEPNRIDLITGISGVSFEEAWPTRQAGLIDGLEVPFISRELLIRNKLTAGRPKDLADVESLQRSSAS